MGNTFLTPSIIAKEALMILRNNCVMANLVHRDFSDDFVAGVGDTITVRKPATFEAKEFSGTISVQDATEQGVTVKMDKHLDVSFAVTSKQLSMEIPDFANLLLAPAMQAIAEKVDNLILTQAKNVTNSVTVAKDVATSADDVVELRKYLNKGKAPMTDRALVVDTNAEADLLKIDKFTTAEKVGDAGTALREASLGRKYGMDIYGDQNADAADVKGVAFHKNAFALVTRPLALPQGAANSAIVNYDGFGLRVVYGYDMTTKTDTVSIDLLCGVAMLDKTLAAKLVQGA